MQFVTTEKVQGVKGLLSYRRMPECLNDHESKRIRMKDFSLRLQEGKERRYTV